MAADPDPQRLDGVDAPAMSALGVVRLPSPAIAAIRSRIKRRVRTAGIEVRADATIGELGKLIVSVRRFELSENFSLRSRSGAPSLGFFAAWTEAGNLYVPCRRCGSGHWDAVEEPGFAFVCELCEKIKLDAEEWTPSEEEP